LKRKTECAACLKYSVLIFVEKKYIKCNIWRAAVHPSYIEDARFLKVNENSVHFVGSYCMCVTVHGSKDVKFTCGLIGRICIL